MIRNGLSIARNQENVISVDGVLPWDCRNDMNHFWELSNKYRAMVMGHETFKALPDILKGRMHIVLCSDPAGAMIKAVNSGKTLPEGWTKRVLFRQFTQVVEELRQGGCLVIGGASAAMQLMPYVDDVYLTTIFEKLKTSVDLLHTVKFDYSFYKDFQLQDTITHSDCRIQRFMRRY